MGFFDLLAKPFVFITCSFMVLSNLSVQAAELNLLLAGSLKQSGVMQEISARFLEENPHVKINYEYGSSLSLFEKSKYENADLIVSHYPDGENRFLATGAGLYKARFMYNKFAIMGPEGDEFNITSKKALPQVLQTLKDNEVDFLVPSRFSGTRKKLDLLWNELGIEPNWMGYEETGLSGPATMRTADSMEAYTFVDMGSYVVNKDEIASLIPLFRDDVRLNNYYSAIVVNAQKTGRTSEALAEAYFKFLISADVQKMIQAFGAIRFGMDLYTPYAQFDETVIQFKEQAEQQKQFWILVAGLFSLLFILLLLLGIKRLKKLSNENEVLATLDDLTQIGNRRLCYAEIHELIEEGQPFSICLLDLCGFKAINDHYGHDCGDLLLHEIAQGVKASLNEEGKIYRLAGDEFVVVFYDVSKLSKQKLKPVIEAVSQPIQCHQAELSVRPSIGVAYFPQHASNAVELMRMADHAMYSSKRRQIDYCEYE